MTSRPQQPKVAIAKYGTPDDEDWYTPKAAKCYPQVVNVTLGEKGHGQIRCEILEGEWERRHVLVTITQDKDKRKVDNILLGFGEQVLSGSVTLSDIDRLIAVLTRARIEADKLGLFTARPTPKSMAEVLAVAGGAV